MTEQEIKALELIAHLHDGADYKSVTKTELYEALKRARHIAKAVLSSRA